MNTGVTHTTCPTCRRRRRDYDTQREHAVLTRDGVLRCKFCSRILQLTDDYDEQEGAA